MRPILILLAALAMAGAAFVPARAQQAAPTLSTHQALYTLRAVKPEGASVEGSIAVEVSRDCQVWNVKTTTDIRGKLPDGADWRYRVAESYRETLGGDAMGFRVEKDVNGKASVVTGRGGFDTRETPGAYEVFRAGAATPETGELPVNTLFAASETRIMLRELQAGKKSFGIQGFDAVNDFRPKVRQVNLLRESFDRSTVPFNDHPLLAGEAWLIRVTQVHDERATNVNMVLHDSGIVSVMGLTIGELVLQSELTVLNRVDAPAC